jgi:flavin reductase (DIM6/NTAB) family NADH-FMN oxidoreductase RutF
LVELRHDMLTHGVYIVCAQHQGKLAGLAVAWAAQVARDRILICVGKQSATRQSILASGAFGLSALTREQVEVARLFGRTSSRRVDKFEGLGYHTLETGSPLLDDCAATFDCRVDAVHDDDSRKLIIGQIVAHEQFKRRYEPLIYHEEDYG